MERGEKLLSNKRRTGVQGIWWKTDCFPERLGPLPLDQLAHILVLEQMPEADCDQRRAVGARLRASWGL